MPPIRLTTPSGGAGLVGMERLAGDVLASMVSLIEKCDDPEEAQLQLVMCLFPQFRRVARRTCFDH